MSRGRRVLQSQSRPSCLQTAMMARDHPPLDAMDVDARPLKRMKLTTASESSSLSNALVPTTSTPAPAVPAQVPPALPLPLLLLSLPALLLQPPTYQPNFFKSLSLSRLAFQRCLAMQSLDSDVECRAWTGLAELGFRYGLDGAERIEYEAEKAVTKAVSHPLHLCLSARLNECTVVYSSEREFSCHV